MTHGIPNGRWAEGERRRLAAESSSHNLGVRLVNLERRLARAREGGLEAEEAGRKLVDRVRVSESLAREMSIEVEEVRIELGLARARVDHLEGERQAMGQQLAASSNESAALRQILASIDQEYSLRISRMKRERGGRTGGGGLSVHHEEGGGEEKDGEVEEEELSPMRLASMSKGWAAVAEARRKRTSGGGGGEGSSPPLSPPRRLAIGPNASPRKKGPSKASDSDLNLNSNTPSDPTLMEALRRAEVAEAQLSSLRSSFASLAKELADVRSEACKDRASLRAAERDAEEAREDRRRLEYRYEKTIDMMAEEERRVRLLMRNGCQGFGSMNQIQELRMRVDREPPAAVPLTQPRMACEPQEVAGSNEAWRDDRDQYEEEEGRSEVKQLLALRALLSI